MSKTQSKSYRLSAETCRQLKELTEKWGDTETMAVVRAIQQAHSRDIKKRVKKPS